MTLFWWPLQRNLSQPYIKWEEKCCFWAHSGITVPCHSLREAGDWQWRRVIISLAVSLEASCLPSVPCTILWSHKYVHHTFFRKMACQFCNTVQRYFWAMCFFHCFSSIFQLSSKRHNFHKIHKTKKLICTNKLQTILFSSCFHTEWKKDIIIKRISVLIRFAWLSSNKKR